MRLDEAIVKYRSDTQIADILAWVNVQRELRELAPIKGLPKGFRRSFTMCPVARALSGPKETIRVASWGWRKEEPGENPETIYNTYHWHPVPECVANFIRCFDNRKDFQEYHA